MGRYSAGAAILATASDALEEAMASLLARCGVIDRILYLKGKNPSFVFENSREGRKF